MERPDFGAVAMENHEAMEMIRRREERRNYRMTVALTCCASIVAAHREDDAPLSADDIATRAFRIADAMVEKAFPDA